jgi:hypothetical protein
MAKQKGREEGRKLRYTRDKGEGLKRFVSSSMGHAVIIINI